MKTKSKLSTLPPVKTKAEFLYPGVFVEEVSTGSHPIPGVSTSTHGVKSYVNYLEQSIDRGIQWVAFEPNDERLWAKLRACIEDFLFSEWRNGKLVGSTPQEAFFVRCDRTTMTQLDIDNGKVICMIGVATVKPAEFEIIKVIKNTA